MKTLAAFSKPYEAHMLIARLEGNGIAAFARDEHMVTLDWLASNAIGGVKVDVADEDYERALAVMAAPGDKDDALTNAPDAPHLRVDAHAAASNRAFNRGILAFFLGAVPLSIAFYLLTPAPHSTAGRRLDESEPMDPRPLAAAFAGLLGGTLLVILARQKQPTPPSITPTAA